MKINITISGLTEAKHIAPLVDGVISIIDRDVNKMNDNHLHIFASDDIDYVDELSFTREHAKEVMKFVEQLKNKFKDSRQEINLLVHCYAGVSRSAAVAIAIETIFNKIHPLEAYLIHVYKRPQIWPNQFILSKFDLETDGQHNFAEKSQLIKNVLKI